jgi:hypothetical protein
LTYLIEKELHGMNPNEPKSGYVADMFDMEYGVDTDHVRAYLSPEESDNTESEDSNSDGVISKTIFSSIC